MGFRNHKERIAEHGGGGMFLNPEIGKEYKFVLMGDEIDDKPAHYNGKGYEPGSWDDPKDKIRMTSSVYTPGVGIQLLEGPETMYKAIGQLSDDVDIYKHIICLKRIKSNVFECRAVRPLSEDEVEKISPLELIDAYEFVSWLKGVVPTPKAPEQAEIPAEPQEKPVDDDELPF